MDEISLSIPRYDANIGVVIPAEGGSVSVDIRDGQLRSSATPPDYATWLDGCLALSDETAPPGVHIHLDPGTIPLEFESVSLTLARNGS